MEGGTSEDNVKHRHCGSTISESEPRTTTREHKRYYTET